MGSDVYDERVLGDRSRVDFVCLKEDDELGCDRSRLGRGREAEVVSGGSGGNLTAEAIEDHMFEGSKNIRNRMAIEPARDGKTEPKTR